MKTYSPDENETEINFPGSNVCINNRYQYIFAWWRKNSRLSIKWPVAKTIIFKIMKRDKMEEKPGNTLVSVQIWDILHATVKMQLEM